MIRYTTLRDIMKKLSPDLLIFLTQNLSLMEGLTEGARIYGKNEFEKVTLKQPIPASHKPTPEELEDYKNFESELSELGLDMSAKSLGKLRRALSKSTTVYAEFDKLCTEFNGRLADEMESMLLFSIEPDKVHFLFDKNLFGQDVMISFPSAIVDIEEAGKCLAFERWTASVFHLMRVMEVGLKVLENTLNIPPDINPSWERILKKCDDESKKPFNQKSPEWQKDSQFFESATAMLHSVKNSWRNPTMHIERIYTEEQAEDIWNAVKGFMRQLSTKLKENPNQ